jgi:hemoglobin
MSRGTPDPPRFRDLDDAGEVAELVTRFYRQIAQDDRFHQYFDVLARIDWDAHTRDLTEFWMGVLLTERDRDPGAVLDAHRWLHEASAFDAELFDRWLEIFDTTLDEGWSGPATERARRRAHGYAWAMAKRLADIDIGARRLVGG